MSRIPATFEALQARRRKALIPFITAGDPSIELTVPLMHALVEAGADVIELGMPFSDPMADGPAIQRSSERALKNHTNLKAVLGAVEQFRSHEQWHAGGADGVCQSDRSDGRGALCASRRSRGRGWRAGGGLSARGGQRAARASCAAAALDSIYLLSPTSEDARMEKIARVASGYIYYVSLKGVTGATTIDLAEVDRKIPQIRSHIKLPVGVGFGIRDADTARAVARISDAVVIGSRLVQEIEKSGPEQVIGNVKSLVGGIRRAMDE